MRRITTVEWFADSFGKYTRFTSALKPSANGHPRFGAVRAVAGSETSDRQLSAEPTLEQRIAEASEQRIATLQTRTVGWIAVAVLMLRTVALPISVANIPQMFPSLGVTSTVAVIVISFVNLVLTTLAATGRLADKWDSRVFVVADIALALALTVWASYIIPANALLGPDRDVAVLYALATVGLWTSVRGWRFGAMLVVAGTALNITLAAIRGSAMSMAGILQLVGRTGWLAAGLLVALIIMLFARRTARLGDASGVRFGHAVEHAEVLRELHDTALQSFGQIAQRAGNVRVPVAEQLADISTFAAEQTVGLRLAIAGVTDAKEQDLVANLRHLAQVFAAGGLTVTVQSSGLKAEPPDLAAHVLLGAVREALNNVVKHAGVRHACVLVSSRASMLSIVIEDNGIGFQPGADEQGYGIPNSVRRRIRDLGGQVDIWSAPGAGTRVTLTLPIGRGRVWLRAGVAGGTQVPLSHSESVSLDEFIRMALYWFVVPALAYRICISLVQATMSISDLGIGISVYFAATMLLVLAGDLVILIGLAAGRMRGLLQSKLYFAIDVSVAVGLNLWVALSLLHGTILLPGHEVFWDYVLGVTAFWVGLRGPRVGASMLLGGVLLELLLVRVNGAALTVSGWSVVLSQLSLLVMALLVAWAIRDLAYQGARLAVAEGVRAGREAEHAEALRAHYESSVAALDRIVQLGSAESPSAQERLLAIRGISLRQADVLRDSLGDASRTSDSRLVGGLQALKDEFRGLGLRVELVTAELSTEPSGHVTSALLGATREALRNIRLHSNSVHAVVRATDVERGVEVVIRDQGVGFNPKTQDNTRIERWLESVGGRVTIRSAPRMGTRVELRWQAADPARADR
jgi:signal transduction histidine kinase